MNDILYLTNKQRSVDTMIKSINQGFKSVFNAIISKQKFELLNNKLKSAFLENVKGLLIICSNMLTIMAFL